MQAASNIANILFDLSDETLIIIPDARRMTKSMEIEANPKPPLIIAIIEIVPDAALGANNEAAITKVMLSEYCG